MCKQKKYTVGDVNINRQRYMNTMQYFRTHKSSMNILGFVYHFFPLAIFITYPCILLYLLLSVRFTDFLKLLIVPMTVFVLVTVIRKIINAERPYEKYLEPSLFGKTTKRKSFPSRHTASAFIISISVFYINIELGIVLLLISFCISASRILAGVHFIKDVIASIIFCIIIGGLMLYFL